MPVHLKKKKDIIDHLREAVRTKHGPDGASEAEAKMVVAAIGARGGTKGADSSSATKASGSGKKPKGKGSISKGKRRNSGNGWRRNPFKGDGTGRGKAIVGEQVFDLSALERRGALGTKLYAPVQLEEMLVHVQRQKPIAVRAHLITISYHICP